MSVNRFFQRRRFAEFQPLTMQEMAFPYEKKAQRDKENADLALKMGSIGLELDYHSIDTDVAKQAYGLMDTKRQEILDKVYSGQISRSEAAREIIGLNDYKRKLMQEYGTPLAQRKARIAADLARMDKDHEKDRINSRDYNSKRSQYASNLSAWDGNMDNVNLGIPNVNWVDSYDVNQLTKDVIASVSDLKPTALNTGTIAKLGNANSYTDVFKTLQTDGVLGSTILARISPYITTEVDKDGKVVNARISDEYLASVEQAWESAGKPTYEGMTEKESKAHYVDIEESKLINSALAGAYTNINTGFKFLSDEVKKDALLTDANTFTAGMRTLGQNIEDPETLFDMYKTLSTAKDKMKEKQAEIEQMKADGADPAEIKKAQEAYNDLSREVAYWNQKKDEINTEVVKKLNGVDIYRYDNTYDMENHNSVASMAIEAGKYLKSLEGGEDAMYTASDFKILFKSSGINEQQAANVELANRVKYYKAKGQSDVDALKNAKNDVNTIPQEYSKTVGFDKPMQNPGAYGSASGYWATYHARLQSALGSRNKAIKEVIKDNSEIFARETVTINAIGGGDKNAVTKYNTHIEDMATNSPQSLIVDGAGTNLDDYIRQNYADGKVDYDGEDYYLTGKRTGAYTTTKNLATISLWGKNAEGHETVVKVLNVTPDEAGDLTETQLTMADELISTGNPANMNIGFETKANINYGDKYNHTNLMNANEGEKIETAIEIDVDGDNNNDPVAFQKNEYGNYNILIGGKKVYIYTDENQDVQHTFDEKVAKENSARSSFPYDQLNKTVYGLSL